MAQQQTFQKMVKNSRLSKAGSDWMTAAFDPYHDTDHDLQGYPDTAADRTVIQQVTKQMSITTAAEEDVHVVFIPVSNPMLMRSAQVDAGTSAKITSVLAPASTGVAYGTVGTVTCVRVPTNTDTFPDQAAIGVPTAVTNMSLGSSVAGPHRIIAMGFEVINTTNETTVGGNVTCYRSPCNLRDATGGVIATVPATGIFGSDNIRILGRPPANISEANLLHGTRTWAAREGAYCVALQNNTQNKLERTSSRNCYITNAPDNSVGTGSSTGALFVSDLTYAQVQNATTYFNFMSKGNENSYHPYDFVGAYFTGLPTASKLTITMKCYVEVAPSPSNPQLVSLATPSAPYDAEALELYASIARTLPPGVPVSQNGLGDWWRALVATARRVLPGIGMAVAQLHPATAAIAKVVGPSLVGRRTNEHAEELLRNATERFDRATQLMSTTNRSNKTMEGTNNRRPTARVSLANRRKKRAAMAAESAT